MQKTDIEYLTHTWNPVAMRCTPVSDGCLSCWHLRTADRLRNNVALPQNERAALAGTGPFIMRERELVAPLRVRKHAVIGVQFMGDLFHEAVPDEFIREAYHYMWRAKQHTFLVLTKRHKRIGGKGQCTNCGYLAPVSDDAPCPHCQETEKHMRVRFGDKKREFPPNVYHGLTVCNQQEMDEKHPVFSQVPGKKFLSIEPMLGPVDLLKAFFRPRVSAFFNCEGLKPAMMGIDAIILGGETGPGARPMHPDWARSVRDQCAAAGVPFFFKGWGEWLPAYNFNGIQTTIKDNSIGPNRCAWMNIDGTMQKIGKGNKRGGDKLVLRVGKKAAGRLLDGRTHDELPWVK